MAYAALVAFCMFFASVAFSWTLSLTFGVNVIDPSWCMADRSNLFNLFGVFDYVVVVVVFSIDQLLWLYFSGRTGPGVCFRLYSDTDYQAFSQYTTPEIQLVPLDSIILQMVSLGINRIREFPFIEPPPASNVENSIHTLKQQGALTDDETLTPIGQMLAQLPVDVVIGKVLLIGSVFHVIEPVMIIAAALSVQSPFTQKMGYDSVVASLRQPLESDHGDLFTLLNAYDEWLQVSF